MKEDQFLVVAHGPPEEIARGKEILDAGSPSRLELHEGLKAPTLSDHVLHVAS